jgi:hypothetical protein
MTHSHPLSCKFPGREHLDDSPIVLAERRVDRRAKLVVAPGWIQTATGGSEATYTVEECIPLVADMLEKNHGKPGIRYVDRFDKTLPW